SACCGAEAGEAQPDGHPSSDRAAPHRAGRSSAFRSETHATCSSRARHDAGDTVARMQTVMAVVLALAVPIASAAAPLCGIRDAPPPVWEHVVWIWFENHGWDQVIGSADAPFMNRTLATGCGLATNAHNETHPSLPNYIAATSGLPPWALGRW